MSEIGGKQSQTLCQAPTSHYRHNLDTAFNHRFRGISSKVKTENSSSFREGCFCI